MLTLPAIKVKQFTQEFYLLNLSAMDAERLVKFEVLGVSGIHGRGAPRRGGGGSLVNWGEIEQRVETSEKAYQRPILRKKIDELASHYLRCREDGSVPAIPGTVLLTTDEPVNFRAQAENPFVGLVQISGDDGTLRVLDGQHRLLALTAVLRSQDVSEQERTAIRILQVPAVLFAGLPAPSVVEMFVTINSRHTRLNPSLLFSLRGRQLYSDATDARIHDTMRKLNSADSSPLKGKIKLLGVGPGRVAQAGLAHEMRRSLDALRAEHGGAGWLGELHDHLDRFYLAYFKEVARIFAQSWDSKRHSILSPCALRGFIQASPRAAVEVWRVGGDPRIALRTLLSPWSERIGDARFETKGAWAANTTRAGRDAVRALASELIEAMEDTA